MQCGMIFFQFTIVWYARVSFVEYKELLFGIIKKKSSFLQSALFLYTQYARIYEICFQLWWKLNHIKRMPYINEIKQCVLDREIRFFFSFSYEHLKIEIFWILSKHINKCIYNIWLISERKNVDSMFEMLRACVAQKGSK